MILTSLIIHYTLQKNLFKDICKLVFFKWQINYHVMFAGLLTILSSFQLLMEIVAGEGTIVSNSQYVLVLLLHITKMRT